MVNNTATKNLVDKLSVSAGGGFIASLFGWTLSWLIGLGGSVVGSYANQTSSTNENQMSTSYPAMLKVSYANQISSTNENGGFYGVHLKFDLGNPIPVGLYANGR